jgi:hypothetical protein
MGARRIFAGIAVAATAVAAAGCGGMGSAGSSDLGGAASIAPANSIAFVALDSNTSSGQWSAVDGLLRKFPAHDDLLTKLRATFEQRSKLNWNADVKPALGSELDLVALPGKQPQLVGLTQGGDRTKLDALLQKLDKGVATAQIGDWTAFSSDQAALDAVKNATTKLADNNTYRAAVAKLAGDALVRAYANGTEAQQLLSSLGKQSPDAAVVPFAWASAELVASGDGVRVNGFSLDSSTTTSATPRLQRVPAPPYASTLVDEIPSGALFVADFPVTPGEFEFSPTGSVPKPLQGIFGTSPTSLAQLDDLLGGETAVYVRPGLPIPEVTIVTQPNDVTKAESALADVVKTLRAAAAGAKAGIDLSSIPVFHKVQGGQLIISTSEQGIADFASGGPKLSADPSFKSAQQASAMPAQTTGFLYANLATALPLVQAFGPMVGLKLPAGAAQADLGALKTLTAFGTRTGEEATFSVFLEVR